MTQRSRSERDQDRADLLAAIAEADKPLYTRQAIATARGVDGVAEGSAFWKWGLTDLRALLRADAVEARNGVYSLAPGDAWCVSRSTVWAPRTVAAAVRADQREDEHDLQRQMASWQVAE